MLCARQVCSSCNLRCNQEGVPIEAFLKDHLQHPQLVRLIDSATAHRSSTPRFARTESSDGASLPAKSGTPPGGPGSGDSAHADKAHPLDWETWLLLEYCDMGTLMVSNCVSFSTYSCFTQIKAMVQSRVHPSRCCRSSATWQSSW